MRTETTPFGLIARADRGGLAAQTFEVWRHLRPARTLIVDLGGRGRGPTKASLYIDRGPGKVRITRGGYPDEEETSWLVADRSIRSVFTVEVLYGDAPRWALAEWGGRVVVQANPELFDPPAFTDCDLLVAAPTHWELGTFAGFPVIELPVPVVLHEPRPVREGPTVRPRFYHPPGAAMLDRNGTKLVAGALRHIDAPMDVVTPYGYGRSNRNRAVTKTPPGETDTYEEVWDRIDPDVVVLPRRYGGLSLPMQEAAARGIPIISTDLAPQNAWLPTSALVAPRVLKPHRMKGGDFPIHACDDAELAETMTRFCDPAVRREHAEIVYEYARSLDWDRWTDRYLEVLLP